MLPLTDDSSYKSNYPIVGGVLFDFHFCVVNVVANVSIRLLEPQIEEVTLSREAQLRKPWTVFPRDIPIKHNLN